MQTPPSEQLHDSGHHEWLNAGHHGASRQRHHRQGDSSLVKDIWQTFHLFKYLFNGKKKKNNIDHFSPLKLSQVLLLERRVAELEKESESSVEQHARLRQENLQLVHRSNALEEQLKEQELYAQDQLQQESRRQKEAMIKMERERGMELENLQVR